MFSAVDEQNNQTLTFELENTRHHNYDVESDDDDDDVLIMPASLLLSEIPVTCSGDVSLSPALSSGPEISVSVTTSPAHIPSSSSGYASTACGGLFLSEEFSDITTAASQGDGSGISTDPGGISVGVCGISTELVGTSMGIFGSTASVVKDTDLSVVVSHSLSSQSNEKVAPLSVCTKVPALTLTSSSAATAVPASVTVPVITTELLEDKDDDDDNDDVPLSLPTSSLSPSPLAAGRPMASLAVPRLRLPLDSASSEDGESSFCSTPGNSTPVDVSSPGIFTPEGSKSPLFMPRSMSLCLLVNYIMSIGINNTDNKDIFLLQLYD